MKVIKGGPNSGDRRQAMAPRRSESQRRSEGRRVVDQKQQEPEWSPRRKKVKPIGDDELPSTLVVERAGQIINVVPGSVWRTRSIKWDPVAFGLEAESLHEKIIEPELQNQSLMQFMRKPTSPMIYGVSGSPDDVSAKYFAAYLVQLHIKHLGAKANVVWHTLYHDYSSSHLKDDISVPTMIVVSNLTPNSPGTKLEKARDLLEKYSDIPRVVVNAGQDPMSFLSTRLYMPVNGLAYFASRLVKQKVSVI